ncbi:MAG: hypothetical protein MJ092_00380 [Lachnospiraceae bacterium]|nr:hypothetical protein [Lachnospiraceae bacterium]
MKNHKTFFILGHVALLLMFFLLLFRSLNTYPAYYSGADTVDEVHGDLEIIMEESCVPYQDGELALEELNFERTQKIFVDTQPYFSMRKRSQRIP